MTQPSSLLKLPHHLQGSLAVNYNLSKNYCVARTLTWKTVTRAQNRSSKLARAAVSTPSSSGNIYLPPKRFIPRILAVNIKSTNRARNVMTLSIVWIITSSCRLSAGRKRTNLNMRSKRKERSTEILLSPPPNSSTMLQKFEEVLQMNVSPHIPPI